jgi:hypothetical protein
VPVGGGGGGGAAPRRPDAGTYVAPSPSPSREREGNLLSYWTPCIHFLISGEISSRITPMPAETRPMVQNTPA